MSKSVTPGRAVPANSTGTEAPVLRILPDLTLCTSSFYLYPLQYLLKLTGNSKESVAEFCEPLWQTINPEEGVWEPLNSSGVSQDYGWQHGLVTVF